MILYVPLRPGEQPRYIHTRPNFIADSLDDLTGPVSGTVALPPRLRPRSTPYDLGDPQDVRALYSHVLQEALCEADLATYISASLLREHWQDLRIPDYLRTMWHMAHPRLGLGLSC